MKINKKLFSIIIITLWVFLISTGVLTHYVNRYMPHGERYSTGEFSCPDNSGKCTEIYREDMRDLDIPDWAKFLRKNGVIMFFGLGLFLTYLTFEKEKFI